MERIRRQAIFSNLEEILEFVKTKANKFNVKGNVLLDIILAVEELLVNVISYAYPDDENGKMEVDCRKELNSFVIELRDNGIEFDITAIDSPDTTSPIHERKIGGMGIFLVKNVMDEVTYKRTKEENIITLKKMID